jgi:hypothetical protein
METGLQTLYIAAAYMCFGRDEIIHKSNTGKATRAARLYPLAHYEQSLEVLNSRFVHVLQCSELQGRIATSFMFF